MDDERPFRIGVIGCGAVGSAVTRFFLEAGEKVSISDPRFAIESRPLEDLLHCEILFLCLPTPNGPHNVQDKSALTQVCCDLSALSYQGVVCIKSTVWPGTCRALQHRYGNLRIVHNPEFLTAAHALMDFTTQKSILLSGKYFDIEPVERLYRRHFFSTPIRSSGVFEETEMAKYLHNTFLATKVAFMNEFYDACQSQQVDYDSVVKMAASIGAIGRSHTKVPGPDRQFGFGGACFPKDTEAFVAWADTRGLPLQILRSAIEANGRARKKPPEEKE